MDEGGIYEDGTPEQIFDHPKREKTRRFVKKLKVLELDIENRDYDFLGMAGQIETYCNKNQIAPKLANRVQLAFEKTMRLLLPLLENPQVHAVCEYAQATEHVEWTLCYPGPRQGLSRAHDELAKSVLEGITESVEYSWQEGEQLPNRLSIVIKSMQNRPVE